MTQILEASIQGSPDLQIKLVIERQLSSSDHSTLKTLERVSQNGLQEFLKHPTGASSEIQLLLAEHKGPQGKQSGGKNYKVVGILAQTQ